MPEDITSIPEGAFGSLYDLRHLPTELALNEFLSDPDAKDTEVKQQVSAKVNAATGFNAVGGTAKLRNLNSDASYRQVPLTREEAEQVDIYIDDLRGRISERRKDIEDVRKFIDSAAQPDGGEEISFRLDISKKASVKRAIRKVFGIKTNEITYSMYKAALQARRALESQETEAYVNAEPLNGDE